MKILEYQPTRRRWLRAIMGAAVAAPIVVRLGRVLDRPRTVRPEDLAPVPWIGHC
jgi:hypothetical protein